MSGPADIPKYILKKSMPNPERNAKKKKLYKRKQTQEVKK